MNPFDDIIQEKANKHKAPVPAGAWDNIIKKEKKRRYLLFGWLFALLLCGLTIGGYYVYTRGNVAGQNQPDGVGKVDEVEKVNKVDPVAGINKINEDKTITSRMNEAVNGNNVDSIHNTGLVSKDADQSVANKKEKISAIVDEVDKVTKVEKDVLVDAGSTTEVNKKHRPGTVDADRNITTTLNRKKQKNTSINDHNTGIEASDHSVENNMHSESAKKRTTKKDKGRSSIKTTAPGTAEFSTSNEIKENIILPDKNESTLNGQSKNAIAKENTVPIDQPLLKKENDSDPDKKKTAITNQEENKKTVPAVKKQKAKNSLFIDAAITPVIPIQQYDHSTTFNRTLFSNNTQTTFTGKLVNTSIDPSLAFSVGLRKKLNKRIYFGLGIRYLELKETIHISGTDTKTSYNIINRLDNSGSVPQLIRDTFVTVTKGTRDINAVNSYHFFDIPVFLQYTILQKHSWSLNGIAGVQVNIAPRYKNELNRDSIAPLISSSQSAAKNSIGFSVYGGLRFAKPIGKKFEFFCLPFIDLSLGRQNIKNSLINKKIQQAGLNIGLSLKIN